VKAHQAADKIEEVSNKNFFQRHTKVLHRDPSQTHGAKGYHIRRANLYNFIKHIFMDALLMAMIKSKLMSSF
jgi:hypothetical protein